MDYESYLAEHDSLTYRMTGVSMLPLLREGRDLFTVRRKEPGERCRPGDVVLYRRPPSHYVLHRVMQVRNEDYVILGDNCIAREYGIRDEDILGVMTGYVRKGKAHSTKELPCRLYTFLMLHAGSLRIFLKRCGSKIRKIAGRIVHA